MNTLVSVRLAIAVSSLSALLAAAALWDHAGSRPAASARSGAVDDVRPGFRAADASELEELRTEVERLRGALEGTASRAQLASAEELDDEPVADDAPETARPVPGAADFSLRDTLLAGYAAMSTDDRRAALGRLYEFARWGDAQSRELLAAALQDRSSSVRARAVKELGRLGGPDVFEHLRRTASDTSSSVREATAAALGRMPSEQAGPLLLELLNDPRKDVVLEAVRSLDGLDYEAAVPQLRAQLASDDLDIAARAAAFLRETGDRGARKEIIARVLPEMEGASVSKRIRGVKRLRLLHARRELRDIIETDPSSSVRHAAQEALESLEDG